MEEPSDQRGASLLAYALVIVFMLAVVIVVLILLRGQNTGSVISNINPNP